MSASQLHPEGSSRAATTLHYRFPPWDCWLHVNEYVDTAEFLEDLRAGLLKGCFTRDVARNPHAF